MTSNTNIQQIDELRTYVKTLQASHTSIGACRSLSGKVTRWIEENINASNVDRRQSYFNGDDNIAQHWYVVIEYEQDKLIVDPTVDQFTYENFLTGKADTYIPESEIPDVGVIDETMGIFMRYE